MEGQVNKFILAGYTAYRDRVGRIVLPKEAVTKSVEELLKFAKKGQYLQNGHKRAILQATFADKSNRGSTHDSPWVLTLMTNSVYHTIPQVRPSDSRLSCHRG